ncbi:MAG: hypothetical protein JW741_16665 [Sedimentisphaerales bacterium]|nr:hypothetical protein [Sedimentisphaerales bacterium]
MTYRGRVKNGVIVLESGVRLREGMDVRVEPVEEAERTAAASQEADQLREGLLSFSGVVKEGPSDLARNHDHYLHGTPRQ